MRKFLFYVFILIYLTLLPLIVTRMLGFVFNPVTHRLVKTGLVYISTNPPQANVYVDGQLAHQRTPLVIRDLTPGEHFVRIKKENFNDWEEKIPIKGREATLLSNILLIPESWPIKQISKEPYQDIFFADNDILIGFNQLLKKIDIYRTNQGLTQDLWQDTTIIKKPLIAPLSIYSKAQVLRLFNAPKSPFILLEINIDKKIKYLWVKLNENTPLIEDISDLFTQRPSHIIWAGTDNDTLFVFTASSQAPITNINRINIKNKTILPTSAQDLPTTIRTSKTLNLPDKYLINQNNEILLKENSLIYLYNKENYAPWTICPITQIAHQSHIYFEEKNGKLFYLDRRDRTLHSIQILPVKPMIEIAIPNNLVRKNIIL